MTPILGVGLAAILMGSVAVATAQASLPSKQERRVAASAAAAAAGQQVGEANATRNILPQYYFISPLAGHAVNSPFGMRKMPWEEGGRLHEGVDIAAPVGTPVRATTGGIVTRSGYDKGYGRFVEVRHANGLTSLYGHLGRIAPIKRGTWTKAGEIVGYVGSSGRSSGAHLHFEIRHNGRPLNPTAFMGKIFRTEADLPLTSAARISRRVRVAHVSAWPAEMLARKKAKEEAAAARAAAKGTAVTVADSRGGRVRAVIQPVGAVTPAAPPPVAAPPPAEAAPSASDVSVAASAREGVATAR